MNSVIVSISKTSYNENPYTSDYVTQNSTGIWIRVYTGDTFEVGERVYLDKPLNSDWSGEYYVRDVNVISGTIVDITLRWRSLYISQSTPDADDSCLIYKATFDYNEMKTIAYDGIISYERDERFIFFRKKLTKDIVFYNDAYRFLKALKDECYNYLIRIKIEYVCPLGVEEKFLGVFTINDIQWNETKCTASVKPEPYDQYFSYLQLNELDINVMEVSTRYETDFTGTLLTGDQWMKLEDILTLIHGYIMPNVNSIQSNFFGINTTGYVYPAVIDTSDLTNVMLCAASDFINLYGADNELNLPINCIKFLEDLRTTFNVYWDVIDGVLIVEHEYYFTNNTGIDIRTLITNYNNNYKLNLNLMPKQESFRFVQGYYFDYNESIIAYNSEIFSNHKEGGSITSRATQYISTDMLWFYNYANGSAIPSPSQIGLVLGAFDSTINGSGRYTNIANLQWRYLIDRFWQYNRPFIEGYYYQGAAGRTYKLFESVNYPVERKNINIKSCCLDFDPTDLIVTEWGNALVMSAEEDLIKGIMKLDLKLRNDC